MGNLRDLAWFDATAQAELVRKREVRPIELVEAAIECVENAVITKVYDIARETAAKDLPEGPFTGVPFLLKDLQAAYEGV